VRARLSIQSRALRWYRSMIPAASSDIHELSRHVSPGPRVRIY
jgi:hypothetical protein